MAMSLRLRFGNLHFAICNEPFAIWLLFNLFSLPLATASAPPPDPQATPSASASPRPSLDAESPAPRRAKTAAALPNDPRPPSHPADDSTPDLRTPDAPVPPGE